MVRVKAQYFVLVSQAASPHVFERAFGCSLSHRFATGERAFGHSCGVFHPSVQVAIYLKLKARPESEPFADRICHAVVAKTE